MAKDLWDEFNISLYAISYLKYVLCANSGYMDLNI